MARKTVVQATAGVAVALLAAGCGSNSTSSTSAAGSSATTAPKQNVAADETLAQAALPKLSDFPAGWTSVPVSSSSSGTPSFSSDLVPCIKKASSALAGEVTARAESPAFSSPAPSAANPSQEFAAGTVVYEPDAATATALTAVFSNPTFTSCVQQSLAASVQQGVKGQSGETAGTPSITATTPPAIGQQQSGFRLVLPLTVSGTPINYTIDLSAFRQGRAIDILAFSGTPQPYSSADEQQLATTTLGRLTNT